LPVVPGPYLMKNQDAAISKMIVLVAAATKKPASTLSISRTPRAILTAREKPAYPLFYWLL